MPMSISHVADDWNQEWESVGFIGLQDVQEVVIFEETHRSVSYLQVEPRNALHQSFEYSRNEWLKFSDLASFENFN